MIAKKVSNLFVGCGILLLTFMYLKFSNSIIFVVCNAILILISRNFNNNGGNFGNERS